MLLLMLFAPFYAVAAAAADAFHVFFISFATSLASLAPYDAFAMMFSPMPLKMMPAALMLLLRA